MHITTQTKRLITYAPNALLQSALFAAHDYAYTERKLIVKPLSLPTIGARITYHGPQLGQFDRAVFLAILGQLQAKADDTGMIRPAFAENPYTKIEALPAQLLARMGYGRQGDARQKLHESLLRLAQGFLWVEETTWESTVRLIQNLSRNKKTQSYLIELDSRLAGAYLNGSCQIDSKITAEYAKLPLANWLYGYVHAAGSSMQPKRFSELQQYSNCGYMPTKEFNRKLKASLKRLLDDGRVNRVDYSTTGMVTIQTEHTPNPRANRFKTTDGTYSSFRDISKEHSAKLKEMYRSAGGWLPVRAGDFPDDAEHGRVRFTIECDLEIKAGIETCQERMAEVFERLKTSGQSSAQQWKNPVVQRLSQIQKGLSFESRVRRGETKDNDWTFDYGFSGKTWMEDIQAVMVNWLVDNADPDTDHRY